MLGLPAAAGTQADLLSRLKAVLPARWFADTTPVLDAVLSGLAAAWAALFGLLGFVQAQGRVATATGPFLDLAAQDYCGPRLARAPGEPDSVYRARLQANLLRDRTTRAATNAAILALTGRPPRIFEPARLADTGAYATPATLAYNTAGGWGSLNLPCQLFINAYRPLGAGVANCVGYGGGAARYVTLAMAASQMNDATLAAAIADTLPIATTAWMAISNG